MQTLNICQAKLLEQISNNELKFSSKNPKLSQEVFLIFEDLTMMSKLNLFIFFALFLVFLSNFQFRFYGFEKKIGNFLVGFSTFFIAIILVRIIALDAQIKLCSEQKDLFSDVVLDFKTLYLASVTNIRALLIIRFQNHQKDNWLCVLLMMLDVHCYPNVYEHLFCDCLGRLKVGENRFFFTFLCALFSFICFKLVVDILAKNLISFYNTYSAQKNRSLNTFLHKNT